jgi:hypothetical protein
MPGARTRLAGMAPAIEYAGFFAAAHEIALAQAIAGL